MALASYMQRLQRLLGDTSFQRYNPYDLIAYVNEARGQIAAEGECIRSAASLNTVANTEVYNHSALTGLIAGASAAVSVWSIIYNPAGPPAPPPLLLQGRPWEWFQLYMRTLGKTANSTPLAWAQYLQGASGSFYIAPTPDGAYSLSLDVVCNPAALAVDADAEAIPYPWTDAIAFYAAHLALRGEGVADAADQMLNLYETYMVRARSGVTPLILPGNFPGDARARRAPAASPSGPMQPASAEPRR